MAFISWVLRVTALAIEQLFDPHPVSPRYARLEGLHEADRRRLYGRGRPRETWTTHAGRQPPPEEESGDVQEMGKPAPLLPRSPHHFIAAKSLPPDDGTHTRQAD